MDVWLLLLIKVVLAGIAVAGFSLISSATSPKLFSGLFAGAPVVASVSLLLTALTKPAAAVQGAQGMVAGSLAMIACCVVAGALLPRWHVIVGSAAGWLVWVAVAAGGFLVMFR